MIIEFQDEAYESFEDAIDRMYGYGVTLVFENGVEVEAILLGADRASGWGGTVQYIPVVDNEYDRRAYRGEDVMTGVPVRIVVS